jgi:O-acetyl-ADP-ribose deacetylase (regulator of RNase III)
MLMIVLVQACNCGGNSSEAPQATSSPSGTPSSATPGNPTNTLQHVTGNIYKAAAWINATDAWLNQLGIDKTKKETVVVNASRSDIKTVGGGIDGALGGWAGANNTTPWEKPAPKLPNGYDAPDKLKAGKFALFQVPFGYIYLAVGPVSSQVKSLAKTKDLIANLYYNILAQAKKDGMKCVVLCAISTDIFAGNGKETDTGKGFEKEEFIANVYEGMQQGIDQFQQENPEHTLKIILNNWDKKVVDKIK